MTIARKSEWKLYGVNRGVSPPPMFFPNPDRAAGWQWIGVTIEISPNLSEDLKESHRFA